MTPKYCGTCGAPLHADARFCSMCGHSIQPVPDVPAQAPLAVQQPGDVSQAYASPANAQPAYAPPVEPIVGIVPGVQRHGGFLGLKVDSFNLVITPSRLVLAHMTKKMMNDAVMVARNEAKAQGRGMLGQMAAQMGWMKVICRQYQSMPVDAILQFAGSFFIPLATIQRVRIDVRRASEDTASKPELVIGTTGGRYRFDLVGMSAGEARQLLKQVLGSVVR